MNRYMFKIPDTDIIYQLLKKKITRKGSGNSHKEVKIYLESTWEKGEQKGKTQRDPYNSISDKTARINFIEIQIIILPPCCL